MSELRWDDVRAWFNPDGNGTVPDLVVADTTVADWAALVALVRAEGWRSAYEVNGLPARTPASASELFGPGDAEDGKSWRIWPDPAIEVIFRVWQPDDMVADVSLFQLQGQERLDVLCRILRQFGRTLGKQVALYAEGGSDFPPILAYECDRDRVVFLAGPW